MPPFKSDDHDLLRWYQQTLLNAGVEIHFNHKVTRSELLSIQADAIIIATGANPIVPSIKGCENIPTYAASDVLMNTELAGARVAIIGAGLVGAELGLWLKRLGRQVVLIEASANILGGNALPVMNADMLTDLLRHEQVEIHCQTQVTEIVPTGIITEKLGVKQHFEVDTVVYAVGYHSENRLWNEIKDDGLDCYLLGDAKRVSNIMYAIWDAYEVARNL